MGGGVVAAQPHEDVSIKRWHLTIAAFSLGVLLLCNWTYVAYTAGQTSEKLSTITDKLSKIDNVPARVLVLEQTDREHERRLTEMDRRIGDNSRSLANK